MKTITLKHETVLLDFAFSERHGSINPLDTLQRTPSLSVVLNDTSYPTLIIWHQNFDILHDNMFRI